MLDQFRGRFIGIFRTGSPGPNQHEAGQSKGKHTGNKAGQGSMDTLHCNKQDQAAGREFPENLKILELYQGAA